MKYDDRYIVELSRAAIFDDTPFTPKEETDWNYIYNKSVEQNIAGLLFSAVNKLPSENKPKGELLSLWWDNMVSTVITTSRQYDEFLKMAKILNGSDIKIVVLKGGAVRGLYAVPELRTMGDFDVLADKSDMKKITKTFENEGYKITKQLFGIIAENGEVSWDIFTSLEEEFAVNTEKYNKQIYNNAQRCGDYYIPRKTDLLAHILVHTGKHFITEGAGIRNLCDAAVMLKTTEFEDISAIKDMCEDQNFRKVYDYIMSAVEDYYGVKPSGLEYEHRGSETFVEYMLTNGIFGKHDNVLLRQFSLDENEDTHGLIRLLFPPVSNLENRYKYLKKMPFLLPIAWIQRIFYGRFGKKVRFTQMLKDVRGASEFSEERIKWLKKLDLQDKH